MPHGNYTDLVLIRPSCSRREWVVAGQTGWACCRLAWLEVTSDVRVDNNAVLFAAMRDDRVIAGSYPGGIWPDINDWLPFRELRLLA